LIVNDFAPPEASIPPLRSTVLVVLALVAAVVVPPSRFDAVAPVMVALASDLVE
jgi:hypothetical protein